MKNFSILVAVCLPFWIQANDSTGFVSTGGIEYIKNDKIAMQSENLFISQNIVDVTYEYRNLTDQDITETILFPLPEVLKGRGGDFADTKGLIDSFKVWSDGREIKPEIHVRAFLYGVEGNGTDDVRLIPNDVTEIFRKCGITDEEMADPWTHKFEGEVERKILGCRDQGLAGFNLPSAWDEAEPLLWGAQIVYSWRQTFKANAVTEVKHTYRPLLGGSVSLTSVLEYDEAGALRKAYCMDKDFEKGLDKLKGEYGSSPYTELGYVLKTGANWAKPIEDFTLTVERDKNELVSFCWHGEGKIHKLRGEGGTVRFRIKEKHFLPKRNINLLYVHSGKG